MRTIPLRQRIKEGVFLLDGAMGTELMARGVQPGACGEFLNVDSPDVILDIHRSYVRAGSDCILTNTFGGNRIALARHDRAADVRAINEAAVKLARKAVGRKAYVLGDIGPSGDFLMPVGSLEPNVLENAFGEQARVLAEAGADGFIIETMTALDELEIAVRAVKSIAGPLPVLASMSFDKAVDSFRTMMGVDVSAAISKMLDLGVEAVGFNCGTCALAEYVELAARYVAAVKISGKEVPIFAEPNAGQPQLLDGKAVYRVTPEEFAAMAVKIRDLGVTILGGCCGTGPAHIKALAEALRP